MADQPMYYLSQGQYQEALLWIFNDYIAYGVVWLLWGLAIFGVTYGKSKSAAIAGMIFSMFLYFINTQLPPEVQAYFAVIAGVMLFMVMYKIVR